MNKIRAKMGKKGGFTLVEMLIVVAIIAILIAISIPLISNALDRAKHATDAANERAAKAEILICWLSDSIPTGGVSAVAEDTPYYYDAANGVIKSDSTGITGYGKHHDGQILAVQVTTAGEVNLQWLAASGTAGATWNNNLCSANADNVGHI